MGVQRSTNQVGADDQVAAITIGVGLPGLSGHGAGGRKQYHNYQYSGNVEMQFLFHTEPPIILLSYQIEIKGLMEKLNDQHGSFFTGCLLIKLEQLKTRHCWHLQLELTLFYLFVFALAIQFSA